MGERVLITGGAGFIGSWLAASHLADGDEVHVLVRPAGPSQPERVHPRTVVHAVDLMDLQQVQACLARANPTVLYHLASGAGRDPSIPPHGDWPAMTRDLDCLVVLLAAAAECPELRMMIRSGSLAEYGSWPEPPPETQREQPRTVYTAAMVAGAHYSAIVQPKLRFPVLTARFALTYGPGQSENYMLPALLRCCLSGGVFTVQRPDNLRDMVFVDDTVEGLRAMARSHLPGGTILNLSSGRTPTVRQIVATALRVTGTPADRIRFEAVETPNFRVDTLSGAPDLAASLLGWRARISLEEGIARTARSFAELVA